MFLIVAVFIGLLPIVPAIIYFIDQRRKNPSEATRTLMYGLNGFNAILVPMAAGLQQTAASDPYASLAAAISTGLACVGAGIAVAGSGAAAVGAIAEKPESFGRSLIFVGLSEGIAIYGLIIAFLVLNR
jgi:F0F1-type ATP synthase membrane subunit c/vacuolar-type H+-ATPase subunit K